MKRALGILADYALNALRSAAIGVLVSFALTLAQGESALPLSLALSCALIGAACGTCSKAVIEGSVALVGTRKFLAYLLNAATTAAVVLGLTFVFFDGLVGLSPWAIALIFGLPEIASVFLVRAGHGEATRLRAAFEKRRSRLDEGE